MNPAKSKAKPPEQIDLCVRLQNARQAILDGQGVPATEEYFEMLRQRVLARLETNRP